MTNYMTVKRGVSLLGMVMLAGMSPNAAAQTKFAIDSASEVALKPGLNDLDLAFDGNSYHALMLNNDVGSAHNNVTFIFFTPDDRTVTFEPGKFFNTGLQFPAIHANSVSTAVGADYAIQSVRLVIDKKAKAAFAVVASREFGHTYVDSRPVTIELFKFSQNPDQMPGEAPAEFTLVAWFRTNKCYPDSDFALTEELSFKAPNGQDKGTSQPCSP